MPRSFCVALGFIVLAGVLGGQDIRTARFEQLSVEAGLSQSAVLCMLQDRQGFMWFGTMDGLNLFDGYAFTVFKNDPKDSASLVHNSVRALVEDQAGRLWVGTSGGLDFFDREKLIFVHFRADPQGSSGPLHQNIMSLYEDRTGVLWVGSSGGLDRVVFNPATGERLTFTHLRSDPADSRTLSSETVQSMLEDSRGRFWVGTGGGGLNLLDRAQGTFLRIPFDPQNPHGLGGRIINFILEDRRGDIWFGTNEGLHKLAADPTAGGFPAFERFRADAADPKSLGHDAVFAGGEDRAGRLWFGTYGGGLFRLDSPPAPGERPSFLRFKNDSELPASLGSDFILCLLADRSGLLWIGTSGGGLFKLALGREKFAHFQTDPKDPRRFAHNFVFAVCEDRSGVVWLGTREGLVKLDRRQGPFLQPVEDPAFPELLRRATVRAIEEDGEGRLWFGIPGSGVFCYDPPTKRFVRYHQASVKATVLPHNGIMAIHRDRRDRLWMGTAGGGLLRYNAATDDFTVFKQDPGDPNTLGFNDVRAIYEDRDGALWVGTYGGGLDRIVWKDTAQSDPIFAHYRYDPANPNTISSDEVLSLCQTRDGLLWIGTYGGGLNRFDWEKGLFTCYLERHGLANNTVYGIIEDAAGHLWLSTNNGLSEFEPRAERFRTYNVRDGLQSNEFNGGAFTRSPSGELFFGGINGFNAFRPDKIRANEDLSPVAITRVETSRRRGGEMESRPLLVPLAAGAEIRLPYRNAVVGFEFVALDFTNPAKNLYACRMEGLDSAWIQLGGRHRVTYSDLAPGSYTFRVRGSNSDAVWNETGAAVRVVVGRPFWRSLWFFGLAGLLLAGGTAALLRRRRKPRRLQVRNEASLEDVCVKYGISKREQEIIRLILQGKSNAEIEKELFISVHTVKNHIYNIYQKLHVKNRYQIIRLFRDYEVDC
ncbi:MAG: LuxR C-terminal-related transcriptional regulator [Candidatus Aminicenantes bacterium]|nr:LuxR C-terminal-related transcriptional regulator [Candidatus Aminicenantes bacterium]